VGAEPQDQDLRSIQEARTLAARARAAQRVLAGFSQEQVNQKIAQLSPQDLHQLCVIRILFQFCT